MPLSVHPVPFIIDLPEDLLARHPHLQHRGSELAIKYAFHRLVEEEELQAMGEQLWRVLDLDESFGAARERAGRQILPLVIRSNDPAILQLPWETLYHPEHRFLGQNPAFTLSRNLNRPSPESVPSGDMAGPLRILLFTSLPDDVDQERSRLDVEREQGEVQAALSPYIAEGSVVLEMPDDGRLSTLKDMLKRFDPHLLFLSGHGKFHGMPHEKEHFATFAFEDDDGGIDSVRGETLAEAFTGTRVRAVVLSACESGQSSSDALNVGLAQRLSLLGIPHVVGMRESLLDVAGIQFARALADAVAAGERMDVALQIARQAITRPLAKSEVLRKDGSKDPLDELSLGQWCLPMLLSGDPSSPLLDEWSFERKPPVHHSTVRKLQEISLPPEFVGRRSELRRLKNPLRTGELRRLLITGPGGQGKTALAGKLAEDLEKAGFTLLAWSARPGSSWEDFLFDLELELDPAEVERYDRVKGKYPDDHGKQAHYLLKFLLHRSGGKLLLFFDNLESLQDPESLELTDGRLLAWIEAAGSLAGEGLTLLLTSRWKWPAWPEENHRSLPHPNFGDFLQMARRENLPADFFKERERLRHIYRALHGNGRGLTFFAAAIRDMDIAAEEAFLARLEEAKAESQTDMALEMVIDHLPPEARTLLERLPAYLTPVPEEGVFLLATDLPDPATLLNRLTAVSLVEPYYEPDWQCQEFQLHPLVTSWLEKESPDASHPWLAIAARYQSYLFEWERETLDQAIAVHTALHRSGQIDEADRFALDYIVGRLSRAGQYRTLLFEWLPSICRSEDDSVRAEALNQAGMQYVHLGEYGKALEYLEESLVIRKEIGDRSGEGTTLNNISQIYQVRGEYDKALEYLEESLAISKETGDRSGEGAALNNISQIYQARGEYGKALEYLEESLAISKETGDRSGEGVTLNNISQICKARGEYGKALEYLEESLVIRKEIGDRSGEGTTLNNISQIYQARGETDKALECLEESLIISKEIGDRSLEGTNLNNIAGIYHVRGKYEKALKYLEESLVIFREIGNRSGEGRTLNNISQIYKARGEYGKALKYLEESLVIRKDIGDVSGLCATLFNMGHIHLQNDEPDRALSAWVTVYRLAQPRNLADALNALAGLADNLGLPGGGLQAWEELSRKMEGRDL